MANTARDLIKARISNAPGTGGSFTLSTAFTNSLLPVAGDDGLSFKLNITENGVGTEIRKDCTYTHSSTSFSRGTMVRSTGTADAALNFTVAAIVSVVPSAEDYLTTEIAEAVRHSNAVWSQMLIFGQPQLQPIPARTTPYKITGNTYYVDPTSGGTNSGTFANPYLAPTSATLAAGDGLLFKAGTTTTISAAIAPAVTGSSGAPIVFGVYDGSSSATDKRIYGRQGMATITCGGAAINAFSLASKSYVAIDGLAVTNNSGANALIAVTGTSANCQITNNAATGGANAHFSIAGGLNNVVEGNASVGAATSAYLYQIGANDSNIKINFNYASGHGERGIFVYDGYSGYTAGGTIACNTIEDASAYTQRCGIEGIVGGCSLKVFRNTVRNVREGVSFYSSLSSSTLSADFSGYLVENNDISNCEFNINLSLCYGSWLVQYNRLLNAGALSSGSAISANKYGRNIELFGSAEGDGASDGIVRFNYCSGAYNWVGSAGGDGTEGTGIGVDNYTKNVLVYGNYCVGNEGVGIGVNVSNSVLVFGNICVDNNRPRSGNSVVIPEYLKGEIAIAYAHQCEVFNNTLVQTGRTYQKFGFCDSTDYASVGARVYNNLLIGATTAGVRRNTTAGAMVEDHNVVVGPSVAVVNTSGTTITNGTGTSIETAADVAVVGDLYRPAVGSSCDGTGTTVPGYSVAFDSVPIASNPPIGALRP